MTAEFERDDARVNLLVQCRGRAFCRCGARCACHLSALRGAASTCFGACSTVVHVVSLTFVSTGFAYMSARGTNNVCVLAIATHEACCHSTHRCTVDIQCNARGHCLHIVFRQARGCTVIAGVGAFITRINAILVLLVTHRAILDEVNEWVEPLYATPWCFRCSELTPHVN